MSDSIPTGHRRSSANTVARRKFQNDSAGPSRREDGGRRDRCERMDSVAEDAVEVGTRLAENHSQTIGLTDVQAAPLKRELRNRCIELYRVYADGLAATFDQLNTLVQREGDAVDTAHALECIAAPIAALMYGTTGSGEVVQRDLSNAARAYHHRASQLCDRASALKGRAEVLELQRRAESCRQPVFYRPEIVQQQKLASRGSGARQLVQHARIILDSEPRVQLCESGESAAIPALNRHFNLKHMHWPCRVAAPPPFGHEGLRWDAVRLTLSAGAWRALGVDATGAQRTDLPPLYALRVPGAPADHEQTFVVIGGDVSPATRAPYGQTVLRLSKPCIRREVGLLNAAEWSIPLACRRGGAAMLGTGGHAKAAHVRFVCPTRDAQRTALLLAAADTTTLATLLDVLDAEPLPIGDMGTPNDTANNCGAEKTEKTERTDEDRIARIARVACDAAATNNATADAVSGLGPTVALTSMRVAACAVPSGLVLDRLRAAERHPCAHTWSVDLAAMWLPGAPGLTAMHARVMRYGAARSEPDGPQPIPGDTADWYDADPQSPDISDITGGWAERGAAAWGRILEAHDLWPDSPPEDVLAMRTELGEAVLALADPLRWHTARAATTCHEALRLPPVSCAETPPSSVNETQQTDLVHSAIWFRHAGLATDRAEHARMCRVYFHQIGRYAMVDIDPKGLHTATKRVRPREQGVWRAAKRTCARTLNCDNPDAPARAAIGQSRS